MFVCLYRVVLLVLVYCVCKSKSDLGWAELARVSPARYRNTKRRAKGRTKHQVPLISCISDTEPGQLVSAARLARTRPSCALPTDRGRNSVQCWMLELQLHTSSDAMKHEAEDLGAGTSENLCWHRPSDPLARTPDHFNNPR